MRNSSLVEWLCADDVAGLSEVPKLRDRTLFGGVRSVGERCDNCEAVPEGVVEWSQVRMPA